MNFLSADDMSGVLAVKLRKRLGFGMWAKLHVTGIHVEGRVSAASSLLYRAFHFIYEAHYLELSADYWLTGTGGRQVSEAVALPGTPAAVFRGVTLLPGDREAHIQPWPGRHGDSWHLRLGGILLCPIPI